MLTEKDIRKAHKILSKMQIKDPLLAFCLICNDWVSKSCFDHHLWGKPIVDKSVKVAPEWLDIVYKDRLVQINSKGKIRRKSK